MIFCNTELTHKQTWISPTSNMVCVYAAVSVFYFSCVHHIYHTDWHTVHVYGYNFKEFIICY